MTRMGVMGLGTMGSGITQAAIESGFEVVAVEVDDAHLSSGASRIRTGLERRVKSGKLSQHQVGGLLSGLNLSTSVSSFADCDIVVEAVFEDASVKAAALSGISGAVGPQTIVASNTSSISITSLSRNLKHPENFIGMHFFNPVPVMKLLEVVRGYLTSDATASAALDIGRRMGKEAVEVRDYPGFISNRVLMPMINEAIFALMEDVAGRDDIDKVMKLGMNHPMGPLELADFIGLDVCLDIMNVLYSGFKDPKYRPCPLLVNMVNSGKTGRKAGAGFYQY